MALVVNPFFHSIRAAGRGDSRFQRARTGYLAAREAANSGGRLAGAPLALQRVDEVRQQLTDFQRRQTRTFTADQREQILSLAAEFPRLWQAQTTLARDRKRMLRLLVEDVTVERSGTAREAVLHVRWRGGANEDLTAPLPAKIADRMRYPLERVQQIRNLAVDYQDAQIAERLNQAGGLSASGKPHGLNGGLGSL